MCRLEAQQEGHELTFCARAPTPVRRVARPWRPTATPGSGARPATCQVLRPPRISSRLYVRKFVNYKYI